MTNDRTIEAISRVALQSERMSGMRKNPTGVNVASTPRKPAAKRKVVELRVLRKREDAKEFRDGWHLILKPMSAVESDA